MTGLEVLEEYYKEGSSYLPMTDRIDVMYPKVDPNYGDRNLGWNAGLLEEDRPFFVECWAAEGATMLTITVSSKGIENMTPAEIDKWFHKIGYYSPRTGYRPPTVMTQTHGENRFFEINLLVGGEGDNALIDGAIIYPFRMLNAYNSLRKENPAIELANDDIVYDIVKDTCFISFAEGGAMGEPGGVCFINDNAMPYHFNYIYGDVEPKIVKAAFPIIRKFYSAKGGPEGDALEGWNYIDLGMGNHLLVKDYVFDTFEEHLGGAKYGDAYQRWFTAAMETLKEM